VLKGQAAQCALLYNDKPDSMNARWQQVVVLFNALATIAWLAWQWPRSPLVALAGVAGALALFALVLWLQFVIMRRVNRSDPAPRPSWQQVVAAWWAEARLALVVFGWRQPFRHNAVPDWLPSLSPLSPLSPGQQATRRGVVLVHGFLCNRGFWLPWMAALRERGHAHVAVTLEPAFGSIDDYTATIDAAVQRVQEATGMAPVVVGPQHGRAGGPRLAALVACGQRCGARAPGHHAGNAAWRHLGRAFQPLGEWPANGAGGRVGAAIAAGRACGPCGPVYLLVFELRQHRFSRWHGDVAGGGQPVGGGGCAYADGF
jgi:hypothetical protein